MPDDTQRFIWQAGGTDLSWTPVAMASTALNVMEGDNIEVVVKPEKEVSDGDTQDLSLRKDPKFLVGVAVSVYQNSGALLYPATVTCD